MPVPTAKLWATASWATVGSWPLALSSPEWIYMSDESPAIAPLYPYGQCGESIKLHDGRIVLNDHAEEGRVEFGTAPGTEVRWRIASTRGPGLGPIGMHLPLPVGQVDVHGACNRRGIADCAGYLDPTEVGSRSNPIDHVVVHWLNVSAIRAPGVIHDAHTQSTYAGRWTAALAGWTVTMDRRADHKDVWPRARSTGSIVMTHVMTIRRIDGASFTAADVDPVLSALHLGMSFALGRWVAPALPVGLDRDGGRVWEQWGARLCTPGAPGALRWWYEQREWELAALLDLLITRFTRADEQFGLRFILSSAVHSAAGGFVEQRIMTAFAAIEHLMWTRLVTRGGMSKSKYKGTHAYKNLSQVLADSGIDGEIDSDALPALHRAAQRRPPDIPRTGPAIACHVRNMIVHPTNHEDELYRQDDGLVRETWLLSHHYLVLLILNHLGYTGAYQRRLAPGGWAGDVEPVPWAA